MCGTDAPARQYENLLASGVIDPTKVVRSALQNAVSVAGLMLTTDAMIADKPEKKKAPAMLQMGDDMYQSIMQTVTVSIKFQVVIPKCIREAMRLRPGQKLKVIEYNGRIELIPDRDISELRGF